VAYTRRDVGVHGLPLLGFADWNDTINLPAGSESVFTAALYGKALLEMIELADFRGDAEGAQTYRAWYEEMKANFNQHAWDGAWYVNYFDADGSPLGSRNNRYGQIFNYGQSWAVISGFAPPERARQSLEAVYQRLNTRNGIKLSTPGFNGFDPQQGGITTYPPGAKENGGIFLHTNPWMVIAETMLGSGERAFTYYHQINPAAKNDKIAEFECEPYVYPQNILGDEHPQFGLARNSWLTGTAAWAYLAVTQHILGLRPAYDGLLIDPCLPPEWEGFQIRRVFRNMTYNIIVQNPQRVCKVVRSLVIDGQAYPGNLMPAFVDGQRHQVLVTLG
jgi:cellobiose phosphorylase